MLSKVIGKAKEIRRKSFMFQLLINKCKMENISAYHTTLKIKVEYGIIPKALLLKA